MRKLEIQILHDIIWEKQLTNVVLKALFVLWTAQRRNITHNNCNRKLWTLKCNKTCLMNCNDEQFKSVQYWIDTFQQKNLKSWFCELQVMLSLKILSDYLSNCVLNNTATNCYMATCVFVISITYYYVRDLCIHLHE